MRHHYKSKKIYLFLQTFYSQINKCKEFTSTLKKVIVLVNEQRQENSWYIN